MDAVLEMVRAYIQNVNWQSPTSFVIIAIGLLALAGRWGSALLVIATAILAAVAHNLIVMNIQTAQVIAPVSMVIYCVGGIVVGMIFVISFVRFMLS